MFKYTHRNKQHTNIMEAALKAKTAAQFEILIAEVVANENMAREDNENGGKDIFCRQENRVWKFRAAINGYPEQLTYLDLEKQYSWTVDEHLTEGRFEYKLDSISPEEFIKVQF